MLALGGTWSNTRTSNNYDALIKELQQTWTEIGETEADRDRMLLELEQDCLSLYQRKTEEAKNAKISLYQFIASKEAELAMLMTALEEVNVSDSRVQTQKKAKSLKEQLASTTKCVEDLQLKKEERMRQFADVKEQIVKITSEISGYYPLVSATTSLNLEEDDISLRKLMDYQSNLRSLQKQKSERVQKVMNYVNEIHTISSALGLDFVKIVSEIHPSLHGSCLEHATNISDSTLEGLDHAILGLKTERNIRFQKLKDLAGSLFELWKLMDTKHEEKIKFLRITSILNFPESGVVEPDALSMEILDQVFSEVERLNKVKASRLKELILNKRFELEDLCRKAHIVPDNSTAMDKTNALLESGLVDPCEILSNIEAQICSAKDETLSRKETNAKVDRWRSACDEENWLEDYNRDEDRFSAGRGAHINLKHAERARITISKLPAIVDNLIRHTLAWEDEKHKQFLYDGVRLISLLENYKLSRLHKEAEKKQARDYKKLQNILLIEKEATYGSKPSPRRSNSLKNSIGYGNGSNTPSRRNSVGSATPEIQTPRSYSGRQNGYFREVRRLSTASLNFVAIPKEDTMSFSSVYGSEPESPQNEN